MNSNLTYMEPIIEPISTDLIKSELTPAKKLRDTNKGHNEIYIVNHFVKYLVYRSWKPLYERLLIRCTDGDVEI